MKHAQPADTAPAANRPDAEAAGTSDANGTCMACRQVGLVKGTITTVFRDGSELTVIQDIPALVCPACSEEFLDDETAMRLDLMRGKGFSGQTPVDTMTVPVYAFTAGDGRTS